MLHSLHLRNVGPAPELKFDFAPRLNILTGDNGLGKTFVLDLIWWCLTRTWLGEPARPRTKLNNGNGSQASITAEELVNGIETQRRKACFNIATDSWEFKRIPGRKMPRNDLSARDHLVIFVGADGGFSIWDPLRRPSGSDHGPQPRTFNGRDLWEGKEDCPGILKDWMTWQNEKSQAFKMLETAIQTLSSPTEPMGVGAPTRWKPTDDVSGPTVNLPYGLVPLRVASAGVRRILSIAYALVWATCEHHKVATSRGFAPVREVTVLMDEVEAHLHPQWQRTILPSLLNVVRLIRDDLIVQVFVATHSPLVLASVETSFEEPNDTLFNFDISSSSNGVINVIKLEWRRMGDASNWLTSEVFDLKWARSKEAEDAILAAIKWLDDPKRPAAKGNQIEAELRRTLGDTDPMWMRWMANRPRKGD